MIYLASVNDWEVMAQYSSTFPEGARDPLTHAPNEQQAGQNQGFVVIDQQPSRRSERFPYSLPVKCIFAFSIAECVIASIMIIMGIATRVMRVGYNFTTFAAFPIWCGLIILANGIIGCILKWKQSKCLVGAYLSLSITSLILTITMLVFYSIDLNSLDNISPWYYKCFGFPAYRCIVIRTLSKSALTDVYGLMGFLVVLMICEFACSIASVALSCKAYSKYCNTCNADDCCTCLGCCECDATPLNYYQVERNEAGPYGNPPMQMASLQQTSSSYNPNQFMAGRQTIPCSGTMTNVFNLPASFFGSGNEDVAQPVSFNVTVQPVATSNQDSANGVQQI